MNQVIGQGKKKKKKNNKRKKKKIGGQHSIWLGRIVKQGVKPKGTLRPNLSPDKWADAQVLRM